MLELTKLIQKTILDIWDCKSLTLFGRCLIAKSLGISQLVHSLSNLVISQNCHLGDVTEQNHFPIYLEKEKG